MTGEPQATGATLPTLPCACASLRRAARAVSQLYEAELRPTGLRATQFTLLQVLAGRGELMHGALGELLAIDSTTLSRTLRPLERAGLIRARPGGDRRERYWTITAAGKRRLAQVKPAWEAAQRAMRERVGSETWSAMLDDLASIAAVAR